jgi:hypothetical protein
MEMVREGTLSRGRGSSKVATAEHETAVQPDRVAARVGGKTALLKEGAPGVSSATGGVYPVGLLVQLAPSEAMVKRKVGFNAATKDWDCSERDVSPKGCAIHVRGATEVVNRFGSSCQTCHAQAKPEFDMTCESTHGSAPIPITPMLARAIQNTDLRCEAIELPPEQQAALKQLSAFMAAAPKPKQARLQLSQFRGTTRG